MNFKTVNIFTLILSIIILLISFWSYKKYSYSLLVENSFKNYIDISKFDIKNFIGQNIIIKGQIKEIPFFISKKTNEKIVLEYLLVEQEKNSRVKKINEESFLRFIPFKTIFNNTDIIVEPYDFDLTYIGNFSTTNKKEKNNILITEKYWKFQNKNNIYIFGKLEDKAGNLSIINPNINSTFLDKIFNLKPFIISNYEISDIISKAKYTKNSMFSISILLLVTGLFFIIISAKRLLS